MTAFRVLLISMIVIVLGYTGVVVASHGWGLLSIFFGDIGAMGWPGQFNLDFSCLLILSALWVAWRNQFSPAGLALGALALVGGTPLLASYLLVASIRARGDVKVLLLGARRAAA
jgi:hypothetical protein